MAEVVKKISKIVEENSIDIILIYRKDEEGNPSNFDNLEDITMQCPVGSTEYQNIQDWYVLDPFQTETLEGSLQTVLKCKNFSY